MLRLIFDCKRRRESPTIMARYWKRTCFSAANGSAATPCPHQFSLNAFASPTLTNSTQPRFRSSHRDSLDRGDPSNSGADPCVRLTLPLRRDPLYYAAVLLAPSLLLTMPLLVLLLVSPHYRLKVPAMLVVILLYCLLLHFVCSLASPAGATRRLPPLIGRSDWICLLWCSRKLFIFFILSFFKSFLSYLYLSLFSYLFSLLFPELASPHDKTQINPINTVKREIFACTLISRNSLILQIREN